MIQPHILWMKKLSSDKTEALSSEELWRGRPDALEAAPSVGRRGWRPASRRRGCSPVSALSGGGHIRVAACACAGARGWEVSAVISEPGAGNVTFKFTSVVNLLGF